MNTGDLVKIAYIKHGGLPSRLDSSTIYILEEYAELFVGDKLIASANKNVQFGTTNYWDNQPHLIAKRNTLYVYTDHTIVDGKPAPGVKIGDGTSYLIDMPFSDYTMVEHMQDTTIHITQEEREKWNNKVSVFEDSENLIFTTG